MLKGRVGLPSCNSGCQVGEEATARLRPGSSPGLFNCLSLLQTCDVPAGRQRQWWRIWEVLVGSWGDSVDAGLLGGCDPPPGGRVLTAALSREGDPTVDPPLPPFSQWTNPLPPPASQFLSEVIYSTIMPLSPTPASLTLPFSPSAPPRPLDPSRELLILSALQISTLFSQGPECRHLFRGSFWLR